MRWISIAEAGQPYTHASGQPQSQKCRKEQRQYEHIKRSAQRSGRYGKRALVIDIVDAVAQHRE
jgi:hypothetical protein